MSSVVKPMPLPANTVRCVVRGYSNRDILQKLGGVPSRRGSGVAVTLPTGDVAIFQSNALDFHYPGVPGRHRPVRLEQSRFTMIAVGAGITEAVRFLTSLLSANVTTLQA